MKRLFRDQKFVTGGVLLLVMVGLIIFLGAAGVKSAQNGGYGYGYTMPWGYYGTGYAYWNPNPVGKAHSNGTLVKGSTAPIYLLENGDKRLVRTWTTFLCRGFSLDNVVTISDTELGQYTTVAQLLCPTGTLLKGSTNSVYIVNVDAFGNYYKRNITTATVFEAAGFSWDAIYTVSDTELGWYYTGASFNETAVARPNGSLMKTSFLSYVYVLDNGLRRWVVSPTAFTTNGYDWSRITTVSLTEMNGYTVGDPVRAAKGTLLKVSTSNRTYVVDLVGGTYYKRWIPSWTIFLAKGYNPDAIYTVSQTELDTFTDALQIQ